MSSLPKVRIRYKPELWPVDSADALAVGVMFLVCVAFVLGFAAGRL